MKTAFIFPAFVSEYLGNEPQILTSYSDDFMLLLNTANDIIDEDLRIFSNDNEVFTNDELKSQIGSYIFSCSLSRILLNRDLFPDLIAGYSMGLYGALFCGGSITFEEGIHLIMKAYEFIQDSVQGLSSGMGAIIGLKEKEITTLLKENNCNAEIVNTNGTYSYLISGLKPDIHKILDLARNEGALNTSVFSVHSPYHTRFLDTAAIKFKDYIFKNIKIMPSDYKIISSVDQSLFQSADDILKELTQNINKRINWMASFEKMIELNITNFIECGAGKSLYKIGKFINGNFTVYPMNKIGSILR